MCTADGVTFELHSLLANLLAMVKKLFGWKYETAGDFSTGERRRRQKKGAAEKISIDSQFRQSVKLIELRLSGKKSQKLLPHNNNSSFHSLE